MINTYEELALKLYADYDISPRNNISDPLYSALVNQLTAGRPLIKLYGYVLQDYPWIVAYAQGFIRYQLKNPYDTFPAGYTEVTSLYDEAKGLRVGFKAYDGAKLNINNGNDDVVYISQSGRRNERKTPTDYGFAGDYADWGNYPTSFIYQISGGNPILLDSSLNQINIFIRKPLFTDKESESTYLLPSCFKLTDAISALFNNAVAVPALIANYSISSEFFNGAQDYLNPDEVNKYANIYLVQGSDYKKPDAENRAIIGELSFDELMSAIRNYFNVYYRIEVSEFDELSLRVEHISYFLKNEGIDFTDTKYEKFLNKSNRYTYDISNLKKSEQWAFDYAVNDNFKGLPIDYKLQNSFVDGVGEIRTAKIITDVTQLQVDPLAVPDTSFVMLMRNSDDQFVNESIAAITGETLQNAELSIGNLHEKLHKHNRVFISGLMNDNDTVFDSQRKIKEQDRFKVKLDFDNDFNPEELQKTFIGWGEVKSAEISLRDMLTELIILHDVD